MIKDAGKATSITPCRNCSMKWSVLIKYSLLRGVLFYLLILKFFYCHRCFHMSNYKLCRFHESCTMKDAIWNQTSLLQMMTNTAYFPYNLESGLSAMYDSTRLIFFQLNNLSWIRLMHSLLKEYMLMQNTSHAYSTIYNEMPCWNFFITNI